MKKFTVQKKKIKIKDESENEFNDNYGDENEEEEIEEDNLEESSEADEKNTIISKPFDMRSDWFK